MNNPPTNDPRLREIQLKRAMANKDMNIAQLLMENANWRLKELDMEEAQIIAEGKANEKIPPATPTKSS